MTSSSYTPISPIRDLKGDATENMLSTPEFFPTPSDLKPIELFPTPSVELISPSSPRFSTPDYRNHFSSFLEPTPSAPMNIVNEFRWMTPSVESSSTSSSASASSDSVDSNLATGSLSESDSLSNSSSSESLQFKWNQTP